MSRQLIDITPCQPKIGAEISGVDLTKPIAPDVADAIRAASVTYQVIVFRDQNVTREQHIEFARIFVRNRETPFVLYPDQKRPIEGYPELFNVYADGITKSAVDIWHTDDSFRRCPATHGILRSHVVPSLGGDTVFSSAIAAYEGLPEEIKHKIRYLKALHSPVYSRTNKAHSGQNLFDREKAKQTEMLDPPMAQPVVRIHPESGKPALYVNEGLSGEIIGLDEKEDKELRTFLYDQFKKPEYQMRLRWTPNTIVVWDNRSVQHYAVADYNEPRIMERVAVAGDLPCIGFADLERQNAVAS